MALNRASEVVWVKAGLFLTWGQPALPLLQLLACRQEDKDQPCLMCRDCRLLRRLWTYISSIRPPLVMRVSLNKGMFSWMAFPQPLHVDYLQDLFTFSVRWGNLMGTTALSTRTCKGRDPRECSSCFHFFYLASEGCLLTEVLGKSAPSPVSWCYG